MAKNIRSIKNTLCDDETLGACSRDARLLFVGLITKVDDHGRFRSHAALVRGQVFPYDDDLSTSDVERLLQELAAKKRVLLYDADGQRYGVMTNWGKHQRIDNASKSDLPEPPSTEDVIHRQETPEPRTAVEDAPSIDGECNPQSAADCGELPLEGKGREGKGSLSAAADMRPQAAAESERARIDELLDSLIAACGIVPNSTPHGTAKHYRHLAGELVAVGATPDEVRARAATARRTWRDGRLTPDALHKRWAELATTANGAPPEPPSQPPCPICEGRHMAGFCSLDPTRFTGEETR